VTLDPAWEWRGAFVRLWAAQSISQTGSMLGVLPLVAIVTLAASPFEVGLIEAAIAMPAIVFGIAAGTLADRVRRRPLMMAADVGRAGVLLLVPLAAWMDWLSVWLLVGVTLVVGALNVLFDVAWQAYLPVLAGRDRLQDANSKLGASESVAEFGAPALGGVLVQTLTAPAAVLFDALSFVASALLLTSIRRPEPRPQPEGERQGLRSEAGEGLRLTWRDPALRALAGSAASFSLAGGFFGALYGLFVLRALGFPPAILGVLVGAGGIGAFFGAIAFGRVGANPRYPRLLMGSLAASGLLSLLTPLARGPDGVALAMLFTGQILGDFALSIFFIGSLTYRQLRVPDHLLGRVNAAARTVAASAGVAGLLAGGLAGELLGIRTGILVGALGMLAGPLWFVPLVRRRE
jgi:MFS family permease